MKIAIHMRDILMKFTAGFYIVNDKKWIFCTERNAKATFMLMES